MTEFLQVTGHFCLELLNENWRNRQSWHMWLPMFTQLWHVNHPNYINACLSITYYGNNTPNPHLTFQLSALGVWWMVKRFTQGKLNWHLWINSRFWRSVDECPLSLRHLVPYSNTFWFTHLSSSSAIGTNVFSIWSMLQERNLGKLLYEHVQALFNSVIPFPRKDQ